MFYMFRYKKYVNNMCYMSYNKIYTNEYLNRDIVVYLKYDVKFS